MKRRSLKKIAALSVILFGMTAFGNVSANASVGQKLTRPESGWTRYDDAEIFNIIYHSESRDNYKGWFTSNTDDCYDTTCTFATSDNNSFQFVMKGSAFRIIGGLFKTDRNYKNKNADVYIDGNLIGNISLASQSDEGGCRVLFEHNFNYVGQHIVRVVVTSIDTISNNGVEMPALFPLDAIDVKGESLTMAPLLRYYNPRLDFHFYTTDFSELGEGKDGYVLENGGEPQCAVFENLEDRTVPLYRYCNLRTNNHFYTTDFRELGYGNSEYVYEGNEGYVYGSPVAGSIRLYRYCDVRTNNHFYTTDFTELGNGRGNYILENMNSYVLAY